MDAASVLCCRDTTSLAVGVCLHVGWGLRGTATIFVMLALCRRAGLLVSNPESFDCGQALQNVDAYLALFWILTT